MATKPKKPTKPRIVTVLPEEKAARAGIVRADILGVAQNQARVATATRGAVKGGVNVRQSGTNLMNYDMGKYAPTTAWAPSTGNVGGTGTGSGTTTRTTTTTKKPGPTKAQKAAAAAAVARVKAAVARAKSAKALKQRLARAAEAKAKAAAAKAAAAAAARPKPPTKKVTTTQKHVTTGTGPLRGGV